MSFLPPKALAPCNTATPERGNTPATWRHSNQSGEHMVAASITPTKIKFIDQGATILPVLARRFADISFMTNLTNPNPGHGSRIQASQIECQWSDHCTLMWGRD